MLSNNLLDKVEQASYCKGCPYETQYKALLETVPQIVSLSMWEASEDYEGVKKLGSMLMAQHLDFISRLQ